MVFTAQQWSTLYTGTVAATLYSILYVRMCNILATGSTNTKCNTGTVSFPNWKAEQRSAGNINNNTVMHFIYSEHVVKIFYTPQQDKDKNLRLTDESIHRKLANILFESSILCLFLSYCRSHHTSVHTFVPFFSAVWSWDETLSNNK